MSPDLTIVVTTYNRRDAIARLLPELEAQDGVTFEVVVAIDGGTDDTPAVVEAAQVSYPVRWIDTGEPGYGLALARNAGILEARGRVVVILDDDGAPRPGFAAAHVVAARPGVMTGGPRDPSDGDRSEPAMRMRMKMDALREVPPLTPMTVPELRAAYPRAWLIENNMSMFREDWIAAGLFSERLKMYGYIGGEFFARAEWLGLRWQFEPHAGIVHHGEMEGDSGLKRERKLREARISAMLRPAFETPRQFRAQTAWAEARTKKRKPLSFPAWLPSLLFGLPARAARALMRRLS